MFTSVTAYGNEAEYIIPVIQVPMTTRQAKCNAELIRNGKDRGEENLWTGCVGDYIEYDLDKDTDISEIRLVFDNDMNRKYHNMPCNYPLVQTKFKLPKSLIKEYRIEGENADGECFVISVSDNHQRFVRHNIIWRVKKVRFVPISTHGCEDFRLFDFEIKKFVSFPSLPYTLLCGSFACKTSFVFRAKEVFEHSFL